MDQVSLKEAQEALKKVREKNDDDFIETPIEMKDGKPLTKEKESKEKTAQKLKVTKQASTEDAIPEKQSQTVEGPKQKEPEEVTAHSKQEIEVKTEDTLPQRVEAKPAPTALETAGSRLHGLQPEDLLSCSGPTLEKSINLFGPRRV